MFPDADKKGIEHARAICHACSVRVSCLKDAIRTSDTQWGIRAGLTPNERRAVAKELARRQQAVTA